MPPRSLGNRVKIECTMATSNPQRSEWCTPLMRCAAQALLFNRRPSRLDLLALADSTSGLAPLRANVWRNHAFESVLALAQPYLRFARRDFQARLGPYDDSLAFRDHQDADIEILWLDRDRYRPTMSSDQWLDWIRQRLEALRTQGTAPILVCTWAVDAAEGAALETLAAGVPGTHACDLRSVCDAESVPLLDARSSVLAGTPVGREAQVLIARRLACRWIAGAALPPVKVLALDLDNTLHAGVLGEDGVAGLHLTPGHLALQRSLVDLQAEGVFLALVSRNVREDVDELFRQRADYLLRPGHFSCIEVSWEDKAVALRRIADSLRVAPDALLFIDDNPGELAAAGDALPDLGVLQAGEPESTLAAIADYPGLWRWSRSREDALRVQDLRANALRPALPAAAPDRAAALRDMAVEISFACDPSGSLARLGELSRKTNQFNLSLARLTEAELMQYMSSDASWVVTADLRDRFADSGLVGLVVGRRDGHVLHVDEVCISCRALGRGLEDAIVLGSIQQMPGFLECSEIRFQCKIGPRNAPAREWLGSLTGMEAPSSEGQYGLEPGVVKARARQEGIRVSTQ